ncbi:MAG: hypothetical protein IPL10_19640 [Bacteroidetes bacterium]|nr:hypothetical protein [Bacteroidota bacterium]
MKHLITLILIVFPFLIFSQKNPEKIYEVHQEKVSGLKSYTEIIPDFPINAKWISMTVSGNEGGHPMSSSMTGKDFSMFKSVLEKSKLNDVIYIDMKYRAQDDKVFSQSYKIKIVK